MYRPYTISSTINNVRNSNIINIASNSNSITKSKKTKHISCEIKCLFENKNRSHELIRTNEFFEFFKKSLIYKILNYEKTRKIYTASDAGGLMKLFSMESSYHVKEEDIAILPYKPEGAKEINREFSISSLTNNQYKIEKVFAFVSFCSLSKSGRTYKKIISKLK
eukprot:jgi/Orpsp1_1/1188350/evm.model.d7180000064042.1